MPRRDRQRRRHMLHQSGINPASDPNIVVVRLPEVSPEEIAAIESLPLTALHYFTLKLYNGALAVMRQAMEEWPDSTTVPERMKQAITDLYDTEQEFIHGTGLCKDLHEEEGNAKDN